MAHIHLAWELGGGLGHAGRLKVLAQALQARGHEVSMGLRDLAHTHRLLADLDVPKLQAPVWLHRTAGMPPTQASLAEILIPNGYLEAQPLAGLVQGWRGLLKATRADLVVGDYAPTAMLAARSLGLPGASVGIGFYSPPAGQPLPCLRDWEQVAPQRLATAEAHVLKTANAVLGKLSAPPLARAADILLGDLPLLCTWPELDHYGRPAGSCEWFGPNFLPATGAPPEWPQGSGPKVFAYLKHEHEAHAAVLQALADEGCRVLCYQPEIASGKAPPVVSPNIHYSLRPVSLEPAMAGADLCVCHGGEATLVQGLLAGVPVLLMPMQLEQFLISRRVESFGGGINAARFGAAPNWRAIVRRLLDDPAYRNSARAFAGRHGGQTHQQMTARIVDRFERLLKEGPPISAADS
ncbi:glycosyltransferase [Massilia endophytica]|uniref:glycosyltransferase n=1 Tax=Massilia endophytica TaxID=2899220 RepID=UPI001E46D3F0|nr:nucleotide disphospho-sugar-binding domain-containing protein [Massilia endophytica]UGQ48652.1 hypothetical protein LSQ66_09390 [Massilia endophytica]